MNISTVNYLKSSFPKTDITIILGIPTYDALHQMELEIKTNAISVHSNLGVATHVHLGLFMTDTKYAILSNIPFMHHVHPVILLIANNATCVASYELKRV